MGSKIWISGRFDLYETLVQNILGKKARKVSRWNWQLGSSFVLMLPALMLSSFFIFAPVTESYHKLHMEHTHKNSPDVVKSQKSPVFREDELHRLMHRT